MLNDDANKLQILAVHAAVTNDQTLRDSLIAHVTNDTRRHLQYAWRAIGADTCLRQLARGRKNGALP
ncbi:MAG: hypothetical protein ACP5QU_03355, partial [Anaerolineae bacterium]